MAESRIAINDDDDGELPILHRITTTKDVDKMSAVITKLLGDENQRRPRKRKRVDSIKDVKLSNEINQRQQKRNVITATTNKCHSVPDPALWEYERKLKKLATRGVVQLFNAVRKQQKELESKLTSVGSSETKRQKVLKSVDKRKFLNMLKGNTDSKKNTSSKTEAEPPTWNVLRDNYQYKDALKEDD